MKKTIGLTYDCKSDWEIRQDDPKDTNAEFDSPQTIDFLSQGIEAAGYRVRRIGNARNVMTNIERLPCDIIFNICEGRRGRNRESEVPVLLEMHNIPFVGADALTLGITLDKLMAKKCFIADGIPTPRYVAARTGEDVKRINLKYPLMVKTRHEGSSKGISEKSRVKNFAELQERTGFIHDVYQQPALIEEFVSGTEFTVAVIGNSRPEALPVVQVSIDGQTDLGEEFYTFERIHDSALRYVCPAPIDEALEEQLKTLAVKACKAVDCRDIGRVDFRVDRQGHPFVLEINPLPSLAKADVFNIIPAAFGKTFSELIARVICFGLERYGLCDAKEKKILEEPFLTRQISKF